MYLTLNFLHNAIVLVCLRVLILSDPSITHSNITAALDTLPPYKWRVFGEGLYVPQSKLDQIESQFTSDEERKDKVIKIYPKNYPHPTWEHVSDALYVCGGIGEDQQYLNVLERLQSMFPTGECQFLPS